MRRSWSIEHAERFGLSQLHQLRGRVGRGAAEPRACCCSRSRSATSPSCASRSIFENTDGFEIARQDLVIRGPGEFLGARQSGVPLLRFADLERDVALIEQARDRPTNCSRATRRPRRRTSSAGWAGARSSSKPDPRSQGSCLRPCPCALRYNSRLGRRRRPDVAMSLYALGISTTPPRRSKCARGSRSRPRC